jgi:DNA polymerase
MEKSKEELLANLKKRLNEDKTLPLLESNLVFGEGNINAFLMFIGEAPGFFEDQKQRPFVGKAGQLLNKLIEEILKLKREDVYITNIAKIIATLGRFSMNYFLKDAKISKDHGKIFWFNKKIIFPLYHPAAALRSNEVLKELKFDFKKLKIILEKYPQLLEKKKKSLNFNIQKTLF